jgi:hypothetical protein
LLSIIAALAVFCNFVNRRKYGFIEGCASSFRCWYRRCVGGLRCRAVRAGSYAAGKLTLALWDHWVPKANDATKALIDEWAADLAIKFRQCSARQAKRVGWFEP